jgi:hypothetical protein
MSAPSIHSASAFPINNVWMKRRSVAIKPLTLRYILLSSALAASAGALCRRISSNRFSL